MVPLMRDYGISVQVGNRLPLGYSNRDTERRYEIFLRVDGRLWIPGEDKVFNDIHEIGLAEFFEPNEIVARFLDAIESSKTLNRQKSEKLMLAKRLLIAVRDSLREEPKREV